MWTATIQSVDKIEGQIRVVVKYTNGTETFTEPQVFEALTLNTLQQRVKSRIDAISASYDLADSLIPGDSIDPPTPPPIPEPDEKLIALQRLREVKDLISLGVLKDTDPALAEAVAAVKDTL